MIEGAPPVATPVPPASQPAPPGTPQQAAPWAPGGVAGVARGGSALPKILGGIALFVVAVIAIALVATSGPADAVTAHMTALAKGDDAAAYALTSSGFRSETSAAQFTAFVNANPILRNGTVSIGEREVSGDTAAVTAELTAPDGSKRTLDVQLVKEEDWRIAGYRLRASASGAAPPGSARTAKGTVAQILISDEADKDGAVRASKDIFAPTTPRIYVSVVLTGAKKGDKASASLAHLPSGAKLGPATNDVTADGDLISSFSFSRPTAGWPEGAYELAVALASGESASATFTVAAERGGQTKAPDCADVIHISGVTISARSKTDGTIFLDQFRTTNDTTRTYLCEIVFEFTGPGGQRVATWKRLVEIKPGVNATQEGGFAFFHWIDTPYQDGVTVKASVTRGSGNPVGQ